MDKKKKKRYGYEGSPRFKPITPWGYFSYSFLFLIPVIGIIFNIFFCFDDTNMNRRNFARSIWCAYLVVLALILVIIISMIGFGMSADVYNALDALRDNIGALGNL